MKLTIRIRSAIAVITIAYSFLACNLSQKGTPMLTDDKYHLISDSLKLSPAVKVIFDSRKQQLIAPSIKKFNFNHLPTKPFDTNGFKPFVKQPQETNFNIDALPSKDFDLDKIAAKHLTYKTTLLPEPKIKKDAEMKMVKPDIAWLGNEEGMAGSNIFSVLKDSRGLLWIPVKQNLYCYNGEDLRSFTINLKSCYQIVEDNSGNIWTCDLAEGIQILNTKRGTIQSLNTDEGVSFKTVNPFHITKDKQGNMWVSTLEKGVYLINPKAGTIKNISTTQGLSDSGVFDVKIDHTGLIWIGTKTKGVNIIDPNKKRIKYLTSKQGLSNDGITAMKESNEGQMIISNNLNAKKNENGKTGRVDIIDYAKGVIKHLNSYQGLATGSLVFSIEQNKAGDIYLGTGGQGISIINLPKQLYKQLDISGGLNNNTICSVISDSTGGIWAAALSGIARIGQKKGLDITHSGKSYIESVVEDQLGYIWMRLYDRIEIFDPKTGLVKMLTQKEGLSKARLSNLWTADGKTYLSTYGDGLYVFDPARQTVEHVGKAEGLTSDTIFNAFKAKNGKIWLLKSNSGGIDIYDPDTKKVVTLDVSNGLASNYVSPEMKTDLQNDIWIGTSKGINIYNIENNTIRRLMTNGIKGAGIFFDLDDKGHMWIGVGSRIFVADIENHTLNKFITPEVAPISDIRSVNYNKSRIFIRSTEGLTIIHPPSPDSATGRKGEWWAELLGRAAGFVNSNSAYYSDFVTKKGEFLWGDSGLTILHSINERIPPQKTFITYLHFITEHFNFLDPLLLHRNGFDTIWSAKNDTFYLIALR